MKTALVTGATSGIGLDFARLLAKDGYHLILVARGEERLRELANELGNAEYIVADLAKDVPRIDQPVDVLINNAGYALFGEFAKTDWATEQAMIAVNVQALSALTKQVLPGMIARKSGRILNVASTAAFQPGPLMAVYYATKAYVLSFSEALAEELAGTGVSVTALCPGPTKTGFQERAKMEESKLVKGKKIMGSKEVAEAGYRAMKRGARVVIPGLKNRVLAQSVRFMPRAAVTKIVKRTQEAAQ